MNGLLAQLPEAETMHW